MLINVVGMIFLIGFSFQILVVNAVKMLNNFFFHNQIWSGTITATLPIKKKLKIIIMSIYFTNSMLF